MSMFLFIFGFFYFDSLNAIRQYIATFIVIISHKHIFDKKWKFLLSVIIALLFHYSAIISLIMLSIKKSRINYKNIMGLYIGVGLYFIFSDEFTTLLFLFIKNITFFDEIWSLSGYD